MVIRAVHMRCCLESRGDIEALGERRRSASALRRLVYRDENDSAIWQCYWCSSLLSLLLLPMLTLLLSVLLLSLLLLLLLLLVKMESRGDIETLGKRRRSASAPRRLVYRDENDWAGRKKNMVIHARDRETERPRDRETVAAK